MRGYQEALRTAKAEAKDRFPEDEYTINVLMWCDDDFRITVRHGFGETGASDEMGNALAEEIVVTPHRAEVQLKEITQSEHYNIHKTEDL